jgi:hypothetical protein
MFLGVYLKDFREKAIAWKISLVFPFNAGDEFGGGTRLWPADEHAEAWAQGPQRPQVKHDLARLINLSRVIGTP